MTKWTRKTGFITRSNTNRTVLIGRRLFLAGVILSATGCKNFVQRAQSPDNLVLPLRDEKKKVVTTGYIGDICGIYGLNYAKIEGIGIAVSLDGTGSNPKPGGQRDYLTRELEAKSNDLDVEKMMASSNTELVLMKGMLPPGIRKGEKFDIEIGTLGATEATSLEGGMVLQANMRPMEQLGRGVKQGHVLALGKGRVLVDGLFETRNDQPNQLHGYILGGGVALENRELGLTIRGDEFTPKTTTMIARAINSRFTRVDNTGRHGVAEPKTDRFVEIVVPESHQHNIGRYLQVIIHMAHSETASQRLARMEELGQEMLDPNLSAVTSLRLEALGNDGIPMLKRALKHPDLEVKFQAAQALAYMGEVDGVEHLEFVAKTEPAFRWHALTALASLEDVEAGMALGELMHVKSAETRYGAFRALLARSPHDPLVAGQWIGDFFLHRIPSETKDPMLHFSRIKRPEIVVFGENQTVDNDFLYVESRVTVRSMGNGTVSITRYAAEGGEDRKICSNRVSDLTETLAKSGFGYGDLLKMFRASKYADSLNSRLVVNAVPRLGRSYVPGQTQDEVPPEESDRYLAEPLPGLFNSGDEDTPESIEVNPKKKLVGGKKKTDAPQQKTTTLNRMKGWFSGREPE